MTHTAVIGYEILINVDRLIKLSKTKPIRRRSLKALNAEALLRTTRSGFTYRQYQNVDISIPLLVSTNNILLDGRHRLCRLFDMGRKTAKVIIMTDKEIDSCIINRRMTY